MVSTKIQHVVDKNLLIKVIRILVGLFTNNNMNFVLYIFFVKNKIFSSKQVKGVFFKRNHKIHFLNPLLS